MDKARRFVQAVENLMGGVGGTAAPPVFISYNFGQRLVDRTRFLEKAALMDEQFRRNVKLFYIPALLSIHIAMTANGHIRFRALQSKQSNRKDEIHDETGCL